MILVLIATLLLILFLEYTYMNKEICTPAFLFTAPFVVLCIVALICARVWNFQMHWNTFFVILCGNVFFFLGTALADKISFKRKQLNYLVIQDENESWFRYFLFLGGQCVCYLWKLRLILQFARRNGVAGGISAALKYYDHIIKFTTESTFRMPRILSLGLDVCTAFGYVCACVLAQKLLQDKKKNFFIVILNFTVAVMGGLSSGGRGLAIRYLIAFLIAYLILGFRQKEWKTAIEFKQIIKIILALLAIVSFFIYSRQMVGRGNVTEVWIYLSKYIGAQLYNLDHYLNKAFRESEFMGQQTFQPLVQFVCSKLGIRQWARYNLDLPFIRAAGYDMGNVYTTFYAYIHDFGYFGVCIMPLLFGLITQPIYKLSKGSTTSHTLNLGLVLYSDLAYMLVFSFFSNKLGELLVTVPMLKKIIFIWLILMFLYHTRIKGTKIYIELPLRKRKN